MKLYEYEGLELFRKEGIPVPDYAITTTVEESEAKAKEIGLPVVIKAQVLSGGRYLAGGVKTATNDNEVHNISLHLLGISIGGFPVKKLMVVPKIDTQREVYLGITIDEYRGYPVAILSREGGVAINTIAMERPETLISKPISIAHGFSMSDARKMCQDVGLLDPDCTEISNILFLLYKVFNNNDALLAEINPLVRTVQGSYLALDSKVEIDDSSLYRHPELNIDLEERISNQLERRGREIGVTYVELDGDIAIIASGAGLGMASMDIVNRKLRAANFLETGGAITADLLYKVMGLVLQKKGVRSLFINVYGGINPIHEGAKGVVRYMQEHNITIPVVAKALGNHQEETWEIFRSQGIHVVDDVSTEKGIDQLYSLLEGKV